MTNKRINRKVNIALVIISLMLCLQIRNMLYYPPMIEGNKKRIDSTLVSLKESQKEGDSIVRAIKKLSK